jgi:hypothetical protein
MGVRRHDQYILIIFQQVEQALAVFQPVRTTRIVFHMNVLRQTHQFVFGDMLQVVFQKNKLVLTVAAPVTFAITWIGIEDVVKDDKCALP